MTSAGFVELITACSTKALGSSRGSNACISCLWPRVAPEALSRNESQGGSTSLLTVREDLVLWYRSLTRDS